MTFNPASVASFFSSSSARSRWIGHRSRQAATSSRVR
jgi:hypothetical protein